MTIRATFWSTCPIRSRRKRILAAAVATGTTERGSPARHRRRDFPADRAP